MTGKSEGKGVAVDIQEKIASMQAEVETLRKLREEFPDLQEARGRRDVYLVSKKVNDAPEGVHYSHSCGCCDDAVLYAGFYVKRHGKYIYADPYVVIVGEKNPLYGDMNGESPYRLCDDRKERILKEVGEAAWKLFSAGPYGITTKDKE